MAITTIYTCDRCQETGSQLDLFKISVSAVYQYSPVMVRTADWCQACLKATRVWPYYEAEVRKAAAKAGEQPPPPVQLEDIVREIVRDEIGSQ